MDSEVPMSYWNMFEDSFMGREDVKQPAIYSQKKLLTIIILIILITILYVGIVLSLFRQHHVFTMSIILDLGEQLNFF